LAQQGKFDKAEAAYNSIIDSTNEPWLKDWAGSELLNVYQKQNRLDDLAKKLEEGLKAKPDDPYLNKRLGELYARKGNNAKALELYEEAAKLTSDRGLKNRLLDMYEANNKLQEAEGLLEKLIKENPSELYLTERLAMLYERQGKKDAAVKTWEAIAAKGTKDSNFYQRYADSLMRMSNPEGALSQLKKAQGLEPGNMSFVLRSGVILMNAGKSKEAKAAFEKVLADTGARDAWVKDEAKRLLGQLEAMAVTNAKPVIQEIAKPVAQREPVKKEVTVQPSEVLRRVQVNASTEHSDETLPRAELLQKEEPAEKIQVEEVKPAVEAETTKAAAKAEAKP
jgi:tetratricopeptide (TPR) repeat protein